MFKGIKVIIQDNLPKLLQPQSLAILLTLIFLILIFIVITRKTKLNTIMLSYGAISIATAFILAYLKLFQLPNGGAITLASMLPLIIYAYIAGPRAGMIVGICFGLLHFMQEPYFVHWAQFLLDYPLAFALIGLAGLFKKNIYIGAAIGIAGRLFCHFLSGVIFFYMYAGNMNVYLYSFLYNLSYLLPDALICMGIMLIPSMRSAVKRLSRTNL